MAKQNSVRRQRVALGKTRVCTAKKGRKEGLWVLGLQGSPLCFSYTIRDMVQWARYGSVGYASVRPEFGYLPHIKARMMALTPIHPALRSGDRRIAGAFWQPP